MKVSMHSQNVSFLFVMLLITLSFYSSPALRSNGLERTMLNKRSSVTTLFGIRRSKLAPKQAPISLPDELVDVIKPLKRKWKTSAEIDSSSEPISSSPPPLKKKRTVKTTKPTTPTQIQTNVEEPTSVIDQPPEDLSFPSSALFIPSEKSHNPNIFDPEIPLLLPTTTTLTTPTKTSKELSTKEKLFDFISTALVIDFFVIVAFLVWFLVGVVTQSAAPVILDSFRSIFQPVVVPVLTVLMVGSIASGFFGKENEEDNNNRKRRRS